MGCSYFYRYSNGWKDLTDDQRKERLLEWNNQLCVDSPLPERELDSIWKWVIDTHRKKRDQERQDWEDKQVKQDEEFRKHVPPTMSENKVKSITELGDSIAQYLLVIIQYSL